jgi:hypothetical protein
MPSYRNNADSSRILGIYGKFDPGEVRIVPRYVWPLPADFEMVGHAQSPVRLLFSGAPDDFDQLSGVSEFAQVIISNTSGASLTVTLNEDTENAFDVASDASWTLENDSEFDTIDISGDGTDSFQVVGIKA